MQTRSGLTYGHLATVLRAQGFTDTQSNKARFLAHQASDAELILPLYAIDTEPLYAHHYTAAKAMVDDYDLLTRNAFDLLLLQASRPPLFAATAASVTA